MAQIRGTANYHLGNQSPFGGQAKTEATADPNPLDAIREQTSKLEDLLDTVSEPIKPYLPAIGRFLIVVTFLEDALRIITQWGDQLTYLNQYRHSTSISLSPQNLEDTSIYTQIFITSTPLRNHPPPSKRNH